MTLACRSRVRNAFACVGHRCLLHGRNVKYFSSTAHTRTPRWAAACNHSVNGVFRRGNADFGIDWSHIVQPRGPKVPVTLLGGFLGAGKTTLLRSLLENSDGFRFGVVVNDVASVNIDARLIADRSSIDGVEVAELANGCVCCSLADDLFASVTELLGRDHRGRLDHIIVELSGVGEPEAVRRNWSLGRAVNHPVAFRTGIDRVVTVVDASMFGADWLDGRAAVERSADAQEGHQSRRSVVGLLAEQIETADTILISKVDIASDPELDAARGVVQSLNPTANVLLASFGKVEPAQLLPPRDSGGSERAQAADTQQSPSAAAEQGTTFDGVCWRQSDVDVTFFVPLREGLRPRSLQFKVTEETVQLGASGAKPILNLKLAGKVSPSNSWWEVEEEEEEDGNFTCLGIVTLEKASKGFWPEVLQKEKETPVDTLASESRHERSGHSVCSEQGHGHSHDHGHGHDHDHGDSPKMRWGIDSFIYRARRPFNSDRLRELGDEITKPMIERQLDPDEVLSGLLRSKGTCWLDHDPKCEYHLSFAGRSFSLLKGDPWWGACSAEHLRWITAYPGVQERYDRAKAECWDEEWGDRRQELVFIGGSKMDEAKVRYQLDACLLTDDEMAEFIADGGDGLLKFDFSLGPGTSIKMG